MIRGTGGEREAETYKADTKVDNRQMDEKRDQMCGNGVASIFLLQAR